MRISYRHRFIFVHVPKTGGTSVSKALDAFSHDVSDVERLFAAICRRLGRRLGLRWESHRWLKFPTQHVTLEELKAAYPRKVFDISFKFAFVRNPWDWLVSDYYSILQHPVNPKYELVRYLDDFREYVEWCAENPPTPQMDYLMDSDGGMLADYVGRFENLTEDFATVAARLGIDAELPHLNRSVQRRSPIYREQYDDHARKTVEQILSKDIEGLGYEY